MWALSINIKVRKREMIRNRSITIPDPGYKGIVTTLQLDIINEMPYKRSHIREKILKAILEKKMSKFPLLSSS